MIWFYKKAKCLYFLLTLLMFVPLVTLIVLSSLNNSMDVSPIIYFIFIMAVFWAAFYSAITAQKEQRRQLAILDEQCDPRGFLIAQEYSYKRALRVKRMNSAKGEFAFVERMNHGVALEALGEFDAALAETEALLTVKLKEKRQNVLLIAYANLAAYHLARYGAQGVEQAHAALAQANERIARRSDKLPLSYVGAYQAISTFTEYRIDVAEGKNLESALDYFRKDLSHAVSTRRALACRWEIADICAQLGDTAGQRAELEIIARQGGSLYITRKAAELLANDNATN